MFEYKKKYAYSYFLVLFLPKQFGMCVCHVISFRIVKVPYDTNNDRFKYNEYIDSYSKKKYIDSYNTKWKKKMIDVHTVNKKKQRKYIDSYNSKEKND